MTFAGMRDAMRSRGWARTTTALIVVAVALVAVAMREAWIYFGERAPVVDFAASARRQQGEALRAYAGRAANGSLVPQTDALIAIRQEFVQQAIDRSLPHRRLFEHGRYEARIERADVQLDSGLAQVTLYGRGMPAGQENSEVFVDFTLGGRIMVSGVDPDNGTLRASVVITDVDTRAAQPNQLQTMLNPVARYFGRLRARDWNREGQELDLPIRVDRTIVLPEINTSVHVPESRVPISVRVSEVTTLAGRMAVSLELLPDSASGERGPRSANGSERPRRPGRSDGGAATDGLMAEVEHLAERDTLWRSAVATDHDVVVLVPAPVIRTLATRVGRAYLRGIAVRIDEQKPIGVNVEFKPKVAGQKVGLGKLKGSVTIRDIRGRLTAGGDPVVTLEPPSDIEATMPAQVLQGRGTVSVAMRWDPAFLVGLVCHGFSVNETVSGDILPFRAPLTTRVHFEVLDSALVGLPDVRRDKIHLPVDLSDSSWQVVRDRLAEQDKPGKCGLFMNADSALARIRHIVGTSGIGVRLPEKMFKPFRLPVVLAERYRTGDVEVAARAFDPAIEVTPAYLRFAFRAVLTVRGPERAALTPRRPRPSRGV